MTAPAGFRASGFAAGIKPKSTKLDCALVASDVPASVAGMFTRNVMKAPPVVWNIEVCEHGAARAVFVNSGNANAATGPRGIKDARATAALVGDALGVAPDHVCVCSTGVIGVPLPMDRIAAGVEGCARALSREGGADAARAIMTTDTVPKETAVEVALSAGTVRIGAIAKGAGMIHPNMATMICVLTTDGAVEPAPLREALRAAVETSFNSIGVDNDMSTSDTVLCLANGAAGAPGLAPGTPDWGTFTEALSAVCRDMAQALVRDGEGATKFVEIQVAGTRTDADAKTIARAIAASQLCKTAFAGEDPNWGRIACAAGYAGIDFDPAALAIWLGEVQVARDGRKADYAEADAVAVMKRDAFTIRVTVGDGPGTAVFWTSDLTHEYVSINADYRS